MSTNETTAEIERERELDKAWVDCLARGTGFYRVTSEGIEHIPFEDVKLTSEKDAT